MNNETFFSDIKNATRPRHSSMSSFNRNQRGIIILYIYVILK